MSNEWAVIGRPLIYDMNEVVTVGGCPVEQFTAMRPFDRTDDYFTVYM